MKKSNNDNIVIDKSVLYDFLYFLFKKYFMCKYGCFSIENFSDYSDYFSFDLFRISEYVDFDDFVDYVKKKRS